MTENTDLSKYSKDFADKARTGVDTTAPFAAAEGISRTAITEASGSQIESGQAIIDYERAKTELSMIGASTTVLEAGNMAIDLLKKGMDSFAGKLSRRGSKLLSRSNTQRDRAKSVEVARQEMGNKQSVQDMENAKFDETSPHLKASRGLWGETGGRVLEWAGVKIREVTTKPIAELYSAGNHLEATILNTGAGILNDSAEVISEISNQVIENVKKKITIRKANKAVDVEDAKNRAEYTQGYADFAQQAKAKVEDNSYFMPDAAAASRSINQAGGDPKKAELKSVTNEWVARSTTT